MTRARGRERLLASWRDSLILAAGILPALLLGVAWMRHVGIPAAVYVQNVAAAIAGAAIAASVSRRQVSPAGGRAMAVVVMLLLSATLLTEGVQGVHRWIRFGSLSIHVASLSIPLLLAELDRVLRRGQLPFAFCVMAVATTILVIQPDAGQATAFAGSSVVLLGVHRKGDRPAMAGMLALLALAGGSLLRSDPLAPVPHVEEIAVRIAREGAAAQAAVAVALALLIVPFVVQPLTVSRSGGGAVAVYLALVTAASYWGTFPVPVLGYGMAPIVGYFAGWGWLRATRRAGEHRRAPQGVGDSD